MIDASESSQFVSGLLLSGARYEKGVTVVHDGKPVPSLPHIDMSVAMLRTAGVEVDDADVNTWRVAPGPIAARDWTVEPDLSNAAVFLAAAAITGGEVTVAGWPERSTQPGVGILPVLEQFGATVVPASDGTDRPRTGHPDRRGRRPARRRRADPDRRRRRRAGRHARRGCAASPTCAATRRTASPRSRPSSPPWAATSRRPPTASSSGPPRCARATARGGPTPTTGWRRRARSSGWSSPGVRIDDVGCTDKTIPDFPGRWAALVEG